MWPQRRPCPAALHREVNPTHHFQGCEVWLILQEASLGADQLPGEGGRQAVRGPRQALGQLSLTGPPLIESQGLPQRGLEMGEPETESRDWPGTLVGSLGRVPSEASALPTLPGPLAAVGSTLRYSAKKVAKGRGTAGEACLQLLGR